MLIPGKRNDNWQCRLQGAEGARYPHRATPWLCGPTTVFHAWPPTISERCWICGRLQRQGKWILLDGVLEVYAKCPARLHGVGGRASPYRNGWEDGRTDGATALQIGMQVRIRSSLLDSSRISRREGQPVAIFSPMLLYGMCYILSWFKYYILSMSMDGQWN